MNSLRDGDRQALAAVGVRRASRLADYAQSNPNFLDDLALPDDAARERVLVSAGKALLTRSSRVTVTRYRRLWPTLVALLVAASIGAALLRDSRYSPHPSGIEVARLKGLEPFHVIDRSDLRVRKSPADPPTEKTMRVSIGRYTRKYVPVGSALELSDLNAGQPLPTPLTGYVIVRVRVAPTNLFLGMEPPFHAGIMAAPRERGAGALLLDDVLVLDLQKDGDALSAVLAIPPADELSFATFASRSDFYLVTNGR